MHNRILGIFAWLGAITIAFIPGLVSLDSGGVFPWSYWLLAVASLGPAGCALICALLGPLRNRWQPHLLTIILLLFSTYAAFQYTCLPPGIVQVASPGSYSAWIHWMPEWTHINTDSQTQQEAYISIAPSLTESYLWRFVTLAAVAWCGAILFNSRGKIMWLLTIVSLFGAAHALLGIWQVCLFPSQTVWGVELGVPFGVFVNRNNAAVFLNISLACSLGLIAWRLAAVTGHEFGQHGFSFTSMLDLIGDKGAMIAFCSACVISTGLLSCGSRGGLAGAVVGILVGLGTLRNTRFVRKIIVSLCMIVVLAGLLLAKTDVSPRTLERFGAAAVGANESILANGRLPHWNNALTAVTHYFPGGSGFGTYRYAYLPYELNSSEQWFQNADNLWLEWCVEGGVIAVLLLFATLGVIVFALIQLKQTADPVDHGISTAGWIALIAITVSQTFDFGLLHAGASAATALLFGVVLGRATTEGLPLWNFEKQNTKRNLFNNSNSSRTAVILCSVAIAILLPFSIWRNACFAREDAQIRSAKIVLNTGKIELDELKAQQVKLEIADAGRMDVPLQQATLLGKEATVLLGSELNAIQGVKENSFQLAPVAVFRFLRRAGDIADAQLVSESPEASVFVELLNKIDDKAIIKKYEIRSKLALSLKRCPLAAEPRVLALAYHLDLGDQRLRTVEQVTRLRSGVPSILVNVARSASDESDWDTVKHVLSLAIQQEPHRSDRYLALAFDLGLPDPTAVVPDQQIAMETSAAYLIRTQRETAAFLRRAYENLSIEFPEDREKRRDRYLLLGRIQLKLDSPRAAVEQFSKAVELSPQDLQVHFAYIDALVATGDESQALFYTQQLRNEFGTSNLKLEGRIQILERTQRR